MSQKRYPQEKVQVVSLGHSVSHTTREWLKTQGRYQLFYSLLHIDKFYATFETVDKVFADLISQGFDPLYHNTLIIPPGSSTGAMDFVAAYEGYTGRKPKLINLIQVRGEYVPAPEMPILDLHEHYNRVRKNRFALINKQAPVSEEISLT